MSHFLVKTRGNSQPQGKPRVYFTAHPDDFHLYFESIAADILKIEDCAIYYTKDMTESCIHDLSEMNLFVVPVTFRLLCEENRAMAEDLAYAKAHHLPILPLVMETGLDALYRRGECFGERQYLVPNKEEIAAISYEEKLKKYLDAVLLSSDLAERIRASFDGYLFLSYRKKDRKYARDLIRAIHRHPDYRDMAIWYDEFLTPGESFQVNITKAMKESFAMTLLVTPHILEAVDGKPNYVMGVEYPLAVTQGMPILPIEMQATDKKALASCFEGIPPTVTIDSDAFFSSLTALHTGAPAKKKHSSEHLFLMGLAYLDGVDVEVDAERGLSLLQDSANAGYPEAMITLANFYENGIYVPYSLALSRAWNEKAYWYFEEACGADSDVALKLLNQIAALRYQEGDYERARILCKQCYEKRKKTLGDEHPDTLTTLDNLAMITQSLGLYQEALALHEKCYAIKARVLGKAHHDTLLALEGLASMYGDLGQLDKAHAQGERAYQLSLRLFGEEHPRTLSCMNTLAVILAKLGDYERQAEIMNALYQIRLEKLGERHPDTLVAQHNLAISYQYLGDNEKALALTRDCYEMMCEVFGKEHPDTIAVLSNLAALFTDLHEKEKALSLSETSYDLHCRVLGEKNPSTLKALNTLAEACREAGDLEKALLLHERAYTARARLLGEEHPDTLLSLGNFAMLLTEFDQNARAILLMENAYAKLCQAYGDKHPDTVNAISRLAVLYEKEGELEKALGFYEKLAVYYGRENTDPQMTAGIFFKLATVYLDLGYYQDAKGVLETLYPLIRSLYGETSQSAENIRKLLLKLGSSES